MVDGGRIERGQRRQAVRLPPFRVVGAEAHNPPLRGATICQLGQLDAIVDAIADEDNGRGELVAHPGAKADRARLRVKRHLRELHVARHSPQPSHVPPVMRIVIWLRRAPAGRFGFLVWCTTVLGLSTV